MDTDNKIHEKKYFVKGMVCHSCEMLIENKIKKLAEVKSVSASAGKNEVTVEYLKNAPSFKILNKLFSQENYVFSDQPLPESKLSIINVALFIISIVVLGELIYMYGDKLSPFTQVNANSSLVILFLFGVVASISTCFALIGGILLSLSKQWSAKESLNSHWFFHIGRLISFGFFGGLLGLIGKSLQITPVFSAVLIVIVSLVMIILGLQLIGIRAAQKIRISFPKKITDNLGAKMPFLIGALTFFLPCGFTLSAQSVALLSGNMVRGSLIMLVFALGTLPVLLSVGLLSQKMLHNNNLSGYFSKVAGLLVILFAFININSQLNIIGLPSLSNLKNNNTKSKNTDSQLVKTINNKQIIKMSASSGGYDPDYFQVKVNIPVRWEITDTGTSGCTNAVISPSLFDGQIKLTPGQTSIKEFTPLKTGQFKFSCWMGMITGTIEVIE